MTKSDLKNGEIVECRNGGRYLVVDDILISNTGWLEMDSYKDNLTPKNGNSEFDIMKLYAPSPYRIIPTLLKGSAGIEKAFWQKTEIKEVTMAEIEEKFGCKVKIINTEG